MNNFKCVQVLNFQLLLNFSQDKDGRVRRKEFRKILKTFPFPISDEQFREVMRRVDPDGNGFISYHQFLDTFETREGQVGCLTLFQGSYRTLG